MSLQIKLTAKDNAEMVLLEKKFRHRRPELLGCCHDCKRPLPAGYMPVVTKWRSEDHGGIPTQVPEVFYCQNCGKELGHRKPKAEKVVPSPTVAPQAPAVPPVKALAVKLLTACSEVPHGSKKLSQLAGIEYSDLVVPILKKLRDAGKIVFQEGKWLRA